MNSVVHFEMPYEVAERMSAFYEQAFGWRMQTLGEDMGRYVLATTTEPLKPGTINGGFYERRPDAPPQYPSVVIAVEDIDAALAKVVAAGGKVFRQLADIPGVGRYAGFTDTEGNRVSVLQPRL